MHGNQQAAKSMRMHFLLLRRFAHRPYQTKICRLYHKVYLYKVYNHFMVHMINIVYAQHSMHAMYVCVCLAYKPNHMQYAYNSCYFIWCGQPPFAHSVLFYSLNIVAIVVVTFANSIRRCHRLRIYVYAICTNDADAAILLTKWNIKRTHKYTFRCCVFICRW